MKDIANRRGQGSEKTNPEERHLVKGRKGGNNWKAMGDGTIHVLKRGTRNMGKISLAKEKSQTPKEGSQDGSAMIGVNRTKFTEKIMDNYTNGCFTKSDTGGGSRKT